MHFEVVSTHSCLKAADQSTAIGSGAITVSTHSRLKAAVIKTSFNLNQLLVSTHSRLKAAAGLKYSLTTEI